MWGKHCFCNLEGVSNEYRNTDLQDFDMSDANLEGILIANRIPQSQWEEIKALVLLRQSP